MPLVVLTRAQGGFEDQPGLPAREMEDERLRAIYGIGSAVARRFGTRMGPSSSLR